MFLQLFRSRLGKIMGWLALMGIICTVFGIMDIRECSYGVTDMDTMSSSDIKRGQFVTTDIYFNLGNYAEQYRMTMGIKQGDPTQFYLIPFGPPEDGMFISAATDREDLQGRFDELEEAFYSGSSDALAEIEPIAFEGKLVLLDRKVCGHLYDMLLESGMYESKEEADLHVLPYVVHFSTHPPKPSYPLLIAGIVFLSAFGLIILVFAVKVRKTAPKA